jgi:sugar-specific transcriptional regulator TrmB
MAVLVELGLTSLQARAYLALSSLGTATTKSVAKTSNIARQDLYRIMPTLQQLGLAEKIIATPSMYRATILKEGVDVLLRHKSQEQDQLQLKAKQMMTNFKTSQSKLPFHADDSHFLVISEKKLLYKTLGEKNSIAQKSLNVSGTWESTRSVLFDSELPVFKEALKRGVSIKWITEDHEKDPSTLNTLQKLLKNPLFEIRYFKSPIPLQTAIYDQKEVLMCIATLPSEDITSIWSDNPMFVKVALNYWEEVWNGALRDYTKTSAAGLKRNTVTQ